jgi:hypothetical protein
VAANCWACFKICTPALLAARPTPTYSESINFERYACPLLSDRNPIRLCVPSQNGLLLEPPQRHKDITAVVAMDSPFSPLSTADPFTI